MPEAIPAGAALAIALGEHGIHIPFLPSRAHHAQQRSGDEGHIPRDDEYVGRLLRAGQRRMQPTQRALSRPHIGDGAYAGQPICRLRRIRHEQELIGHHP